MGFNENSMGRRICKELFNRVNYKQLSSIFEKVIDSIFWRLSWNEEFQNDKDKIQYAVSKDANEIYYVSSNIKEDKQFMLELL